MVDFRYIPELSPEGWKSANDEERVVALQDLENQNASEQGREPCTVCGASASANDTTDGFYRSEDKTIAVNSELIRSDTPREAISTVAHEGQHDYQLDCVRRPGSHPEISDNQLTEFDENLKNYHPPGETKKEFDRYYNQPVEVDARAAEERVLQQYDDTFSASKSSGTSEPEQGPKSAPALQEPQTDAPTASPGLTEAQHAKLEKLNSLYPPPPPPSAPAETQSPSINEGLSQ